MEWLGIIRVAARVLSALGRILGDHEEAEDRRRASSKRPPQ